MATDISGSRGRKKKRLEINEAGVGIVRMTYDVYLHGLEGRVMGIKEDCKASIRQWSPDARQVVEHVLSKNSAETCRSRKFIFQPCVALCQLRGYTAIRS